MDKKIRQKKFDNFSFSETEIVFEVHGTMELSVFINNTNKDKQQNVAGTENKRDIQFTRFREN